MKTIITTVAATLFAVNVSAGDIYHGFAQGNPDLHVNYDGQSSEMTAVQPSIGARFDRYRGWADGNPDLFGDFEQLPAMGHSTPTDVYRGFAGNPDL